MFVNVVVGTVDLVGRIEVVVLLGFPDNVVVGTVVDILGLCEGDA